MPDTYRGFADVRSEAFGSGMVLEASQVSATRTVDVVRALARDAGLADRVHDPLFRVDASSQRCVYPVGKMKDVFVSAIRLEAVQHTLTSR